ncbi:ankyrin-3-like [Chelonus insularis]|uniref:ankyrin-3-like n=1 Tax=Chelonus insularis TaxID=460826 RepID=UPI00158CDA3E|nr:ankyrin-3-like [Chelonus insularis]
MVNPHTGLNLLTVACSHRYDEIVENLLKHNADVNLIIPYETWILINQSYFNNKHAWSRDYGISLDGNSLLHKMIENKYDPECIKMLLKLNFPVNILNRNGLTPLLLACKTYSANQLKTIEILLQYNADVNSPDNNFMTPLHIGCGDENRKQLQTFSENGVDHFDINPEAVNKSGWTPLFVACSFGDIAAVKCLLENHANPIVTDRDGETALHFICASQSETALQIIQLLLKHNANIEALNKSGWTPLFMARRLTI